MWAIQSGNMRDIVSMFACGQIDVNANLPTVSEAVAGPPLVLAAANGHKEMVAMFLDAGAQIDAANSRRQTASHCAAEIGHADVFELLIARGADLSLRDDLHQTAVQIALLSRFHTEALAIAMIRANSSHLFGNVDDLCKAAAVSTTVTEMLLKRNINVAALRDSCGRSPLHVAMSPQSDADLITMLVNVAGVDVNARDDKGRTACHRAAAVNLFGALQSLISFGADVDRVDDNGNTPLHDACTHGIGYQSASLLLAAGARVDIKTFAAKRTACHFASTPFTFTAILAGGANYDELDADGRTPRELAASLGFSLPNERQIARAKRRIATMQLDFVRNRALQVCIGLQSLELDALQMCEILVHSCGPVAPLLPFHRWWAIATTVKHFRRA